MNDDPPASVLVVEDENVVALDLTTSLERLGYVVAGVTARGEEAIDLAERADPDLVLMDINLRGEMDGIEAAETIQKKRSLPVIYLTAYSDEPTLQRARISRPFGYLLKPFDDRDLDVAIQVALERHALEAALRASERKLNAILGSLGEAVIATDTGGRITFVNRTAEKLLQRRTELAHGRELGEVVKTSVDDKGQEHLVVGGRAIPVERTTTSLVGDRDDVTGHVLVLRDISERVRAQEERERFENVKNDFFANVSHELRTPLTLIMGPCEKLLSANNLSSDQRRDVEVVLRNARTLLKHVVDLLEVSRLVAGSVALSYEETDLCRLVRLVGAHFDSHAADQEMRYEITAPDALGAEVDPARLQRVLLNLMSNAFKFTPQAGVVRCSLGALGEDRVEIEVADSGPGIQVQHRKRVFERFQQLDGRRSRGFGGVGLGLPIAKDFVELHGGEIAVEDAPEGGALFRIVLPRFAPPGARIGRAREERVELDAEARPEIEALSSPDLVPEAPAAAEDLPLVLVVEDNSAMNRFVVETLAQDHRTASAFDGREGLEKVLELRPDLVVTDLMMPVMSGEDLVREIRRREELDHLPILVLTAKADDRVRLLSDGAQDYLAKPFDAAELRARVANLVSMKRTRDILLEEIEHRMHDTEHLAKALADRKRELETALHAMSVAKEHAERASELKSNFLSMVSHELRTPLTSLQLQLERLSIEARTTLSDEARPLLQRMFESMSRVHQLIEQLLGYARIQSGRLSVRIEPFKLEALAAEALDEVRSHAERKGLALELVEEGPLPPLCSDPRLVRLILVNLLGNAIKFTDEGKIKVSIGQGPIGHRVIVSDTGPGIPEEVQVRMFEPFEQLEPVRTKHLAGIGLGLPLVREIAASLDGYVSVESRLGEGSSFEVVLPSLEAAR